MRTLTTTETDLLTAAQDDAGALPDKGEVKAAAALVRLGLAIALPQADGASRLLITNKGREALPAPEQVEAPDEETPPDPAKEEGDAGVGEPAGETITADATVDAASSSEGPKGKLGALVGLLRSEQGVTVEEMMAATGWQAHSVRGAISGSLKKKLGLNVVSKKTDGVRRYWIVAAEADV